MYHCQYNCALGIFLYIMQHGSGLQQNDSNTNVSHMLWRQDVTLVSFDRIRYRVHLNIIHTVTAMVPRLSYDGPKAGNSNDKR